MSPPRLPALLAVWLGLSADPAWGQDLPADPLPPGAVASLGTTRLRHRGYVVSLAFAADGKSVASGSYDFTAAVWDAATGLPRYRLPRQRTYVYAVAFSPDGKRLATTGGADNTIRLWDAATGQPAGAIPCGARNATCLRFSPDSKLLAFGLYDAAPIILWDLAAGRELRRLEGHLGGTRSLDFGPDGKRPVSGGRDTDRKEKLRKTTPADPTEDVRVWDVEEGKLLAHFGHPGNEGEVSSVAFAPDGRAVASGTRYSARLWDARTGAPLRTFNKAGT